MQVRLWEPCCSWAISAEDNAACDAVVEVDEETAERWEIIMKQYYRVQKDMRAAIANRRPMLDSIQSPLPQDASLSGRSEHPI